MTSRQKSAPPREYDDLQAAISERYESLSKRLRDIARFAMDNPSIIALETIANIAITANVQPSAIIRFAQALGYTGFSEMQRVFQLHVAKQSASYKERIRSEIAQEVMSDSNIPSSLLHQFCEANIVSLKHLENGIDSKSLETAVQLIHDADHVYIMAQRRSFPVANYLHYMLSHLDCRSHVLDGSGGLLNEQAQCMTSNDLLIAISFFPYAEETVEIVTRAREKGVSCIGISDSDLSPVNAAAHAHFRIHDAEVHQFRSLSATMVVAQVLATSLAFENEKNAC
ncbi:MAG: MurR/RpiR family transcriptional regulator [Xanthomonadales bacterium]|nr:MurR/RpiR family transcriptional regulator [Xanthomonadales bacterium]